MQATSLLLTLVVVVEIIMQYKHFKSQDLHGEKITLLANYGLLY